MEQALRQQAWAFATDVGEGVLAAGSASGVIGRRMGILRCHVMGTAARGVVHHNHTEHKGAHYQHAEHGLWQATSHPHSSTAYLRRT